MKQDFIDDSQWKDGSVQEIITEPGETLADVIKFMRSALAYYERDDLDFHEHRIRVEGDKYYVTLYLKDW
jgi:hypothetical protein